MPTPGSAMRRPNIRGAAKTSRLSYIVSMGLPKGHHANRAELGIL